MNKGKICANCKYHYIEEIVFDNPQSCCAKNQSTTERWCKCEDFKCNEAYAEYILKENEQLKANRDEALKFIKCEWYYDGTPIDKIEEILERGTK